jgi:hypothetical protein
MRFPSSSPGQRIHFAAGVCFYERAGLRWKPFEMKAEIEKAEFLAVPAKGKRRIKICQPWLALEPVSLSGRTFNSHHYRPTCES